MFNFLVEMQPLVLLIGNAHICSSKTHKLNKLWPYDTLVTPLLYGVEIWGKNPNKANNLKDLERPLGPVLVHVIIRKSLVPS